ncbi:carbonic anhydrase [Thorsellia kenyensis]|uniref:carbonic anhydrase n=1 Tax=Thorsellia kenyensis TaxID=1549888 RepID=A0ABV6CA47_9GAMM
MKLRHTRNTFLVTVLMSTPLLSMAADNPHAPHTHNNLHWGYSGEAGPQHWAELDESYLLCKTGKEQSPIDIKSSKMIKKMGLSFDYQPAKIDFINNGHTVQANLVDSKNKIVLDNKDFQLLQFHLHTPSEEAIDGKHSDMVIHFVHSSEDKTLAVVGLLFDLGEENPTLNALIDALPAKPGDANTLPTPFDINALLPVDKDYYSFMGSLTTPPCTEGVHWQVLKEHVKISQGQLDKIKAIISENARPIQPLNERKIEDIDNG